MNQEQFQSLITRRRILQGTAAIAATSLLPGCNKASSTISPSSEVAQPAPTGPVTQGMMSVSATAAGSIPAGFVGLSYEKSAMYEPLFQANNLDLIGLFDRLGIGVLRIGGNSVDKNVWTPTGKGQTSGQIAPADVNALAQFVKATGWQVIYGVNLGGSSNGTQTPALAAAEVAYVSQALGSSLVGIEIGNEPDLYGNSYYPTGWSLSQFITLWNTYRTAILATTPTAPITGPADGGNITSWTIPFGQQVTSKEISLLTQHYYRGDGGSPNSTAAFLVTPDTTLTTDLAALQTAAQGIGVPYRMSECNSFYNGGAGGVSNSYASSLWIIDYLFNCAQYGAAGVNFHGGGNSTGYTPIADNSGVVVGPRPEYYGILLFTYAGVGTLNTTKVSAGSLNFTGYAVQVPNGPMNIILNNKDSTQNVQVTITVPQNVAYATLIEMTQNAGGTPSLAATSGVTIQGAPVGGASATQPPVGVVNGGSFYPSTAFTLTTTPNTITCYVPALSAVAIQVT